MKIEITAVPTSKKGTVWLQVKSLEAINEALVGDVFDCTYVGKAEKKGKKEVEDKDGKND